VSADMGLTSSQMLCKVAELMCRVLHCAVVFFGLEDRRWRAEGECGLKVEEMGVAVAGESGGVCVWGAVGKLHGMLCLGS
jgi:hypothetical protein